MEDRQKQIEVMAKIMFEKAFENYETSGSVEIDTEVRRHCYSAFLTYCETLYNAGYRKIHENEVVLTREKYGKHIELATACGIKYGKIQARHATAEKFAERLKLKLKKLELGGWVEVETKCFNEVVDEIAKEITEVDK